MSLNGISQLFLDEVEHDPFRWLEDRNLPETGAWVAEQQRRFDEYFAQSEDIRVVRGVVRESLDVETIDQPMRIADRYFYRKRESGREQAGIYVCEISTGEERLLVSPSTRGVFFSVGIQAVSADGSSLAYELRQGGSDLVTIGIVQVDTGIELADRIEATYLRGFAFANDGSGFYYCHDRSGGTSDHTINFHRYGDESKDRIIYRVPRTAGSRLILLSDDAFLAALKVHYSNGERVSDLSLACSETPSCWKRVLTNIPRTVRPWFARGRILGIMFENTPKGMLVEFENNGRDLRVIIPEQKDVLQQLVVLGDRIIRTYLSDWGIAADAWTLSGQYIETLNIPSDGTIRLLPSQNSDALFCTYESLVEPLTTFEVRTGSTEVTLWHKQRSPSVRDSCRTHFTVVASKDGTKVPVMLSGVGLQERSVSRPVIMTAYGGFGSALTPQFSVFVTIMLRLGCDLALVRIRGGGEYGRAWHESGRRRKRQNAFDDFIGVAQWLCDEEYTTPESLAIFGGSNAGLLVGVALTQRPELFAAVLCIAPLLDMLRYEHFDQASVWRHEYGSVDNADDRQILSAYSPYHHIKNDVDYPPVLFVSGDKDDRCNPAHVRKMAARLQQRDIQTRPIFVDYSLDRGHSPALPLSVRIESLARRITFLSRTLHLKQDWSVL